MAWCLTITPCLFFFASLHVYVCLYIVMYVCMSVCLNFSMYVYMSMHMVASVWIYWGLPFLYCDPVCLFVCPSFRMDVRSYVFLHISKYIAAHVGVSVRMYVRVSHHSSVYLYFRLCLCPAFDCLLVRPCLFVCPPVSLRLCMSFVYLSLRVSF